MILRGNWCAAWVILFFILMVPFSNFSGAGTVVDTDITTSREAAPEIEINGTVVVDGEEWDIQQNITIKENSVLIVNNTKMTMNTWGRMLAIFVYPGGELILKNSIIEPINNVHGYHLFIYGNLTLINSTVSYCGQSSPFVDIKRIVEGVVLVGGRATIENSTIEYNSKFQAWNSEIFLQNSILENCTMGFELYNTTFEADGCEFFNNYEDIRVNYNVDFKISNSIFDSLYLFTLFPVDYQYGIQTTYEFWEYQRSNGIIENCTFQGKYQAISLLGGEHHILNSTFYFNVNNLLQTGGILNVSGCRFEHPFDPFDITEEALENKYGIQAYWLINEVNIDNTTFNNMASSVILETDGINRINDCVFSNSGAGIEMMGGKFEGNNITANNCEIGIQFSHGECNLSNSKIASNTIGLYLEWAKVILKDNQIMNNTAWGIVQKSHCWDIDSEAIIDCIAYIGENFPDPENDLYSELKNGIGNFANIRELRVKVYDLHKNPVGSVDVTLENDVIEQYNTGGVIYMIERTYTDFGGVCHMGMLIDHVIIDGYEKTYCGSYKLTASYQLTDDLAVINETLIKTGEQWSSYPVIELVLPELYLNETEFSLSKETVKAGETLTVNTIMHYSGPDYLELPTITVALYVDGAKVDSVSFEDLSGGGANLDISLSWKAESGVPMPNGVDCRQVKLTIEMPEGLEYDQGSYDNLYDNTINARIDIEQDDESEPWSISGGTPLAPIAFFGGILLGIIIIILVIRYIIIQKRRSKEEPPEEDVPERGPKGQRFRGPGREPGAGRRQPEWRVPGGRSATGLQRRVPEGRSAAGPERQVPGREPGAGRRMQERREPERGGAFGRKKVFD